MTATNDLHAFDQATLLVPQETGALRGEIPATYGNMVGPFGGAIAAVMLNSVLKHLQRQGDPASITVNFAAPIADGGFDLSPRVVRTNRTNQHWSVELSQNGEVACTASVLLATRREAWADQELKMPQVPSPQSLEQYEFPMGPRWLKQYDFRFVKGALTMSGRELADSESVLWIKHKEDRTLDCLALLAKSDAFFPRTMIRKQTFAPAGTVTMTTYFHANDADLAQLGSEFILGAARGMRFSHGHFNQSAELWSATGELLASSTQLVYYK